jgi:hypothetical protein
VPAGKATSPAAGETAIGACADVHLGETEHRKANQERDCIQVRTPLSAQPKRIHGRCAWTLRRLIKAGPNGLSSAEVPAGLRLSAYILKLRRAGIGIVTMQERHGGDFAGTHGRYRLSQSIEIVAGGDQ